MKKIQSILSCLVFIHITLNAQTNSLAMYNASDATIFYLSTNTTYQIPLVTIDQGPLLMKDSIQYSYTINNNAPMHKTYYKQGYDYINCVTAPNLSAYRLLTDSNILFATPGLYTFKCWIRTIDGQLDAIHSNDTLVRNYKAIDNLPCRKGLLEYAYHVSCGPCGEDGTPYEDKIISEMSDKTIIVKLHNYASPYTPWTIFNCPEAREIDSSFGSMVHPMVVCNRASLDPYYQSIGSNNYEYYPSKNGCPSEHNYMIKEANYFNKIASSLDITNFVLNGNAISFQLNAHFFDTQNFNGDELRLGCMLVEDSLWYFQANNSTNPIDSAWHRNVLRKVFGGSWGKPNTVPSAVTAGQTITAAFTDTLPANVNVKQLKLVPILQYYNVSTKKRGIINTDIFKFNEINFPESIANNYKSNIAIYPNPSSGIYNINSDNAIKKITVVNTLGQSYNVVIVNNSFDLNQLPNGIYSIIVTLNNNSIVTKTILKKDN
jgi:Outer membrane protein Omp28/Secretion system C-terminal sorting domain